MGRIHDLFKTLLGRSEPQIEIARMKAQWADLLLDVSNAMEKLKTAALKFAKRDSVAMGSAFKETAPPDGTEIPTKWDARAAVMQRSKRARTIQPEAADVSSDQERTG